MAPTFLALQLLVAGIAANDLENARAAVPPSAFILRGECNGDGVVDLSDAVTILLYLFADVAEPACLDPLDTDDNGEVNLTDAVRLLAFLFLDGPPPRPPFPEYDVDQSEDRLPCE